MCARGCSVSLDDSVFDKLKELCNESASELLPLDWSSNVAAFPIIVPVGKSVCIIII